MLSVKSFAIGAAAAVLFSFAAHAQGVPGGAAHGFREGGRIAGPVGAVVGTAVGGVIGGVEGVLGINHQHVGHAPAYAPGDVERPRRSYRRKVYRSKYKKQRRAARYYRSRR